MSIFLFPVLRPLLRRWQFRDPNRHLHPQWARLCLVFPGLAQWPTRTPAQVMSPKKMSTTTRRFRKQFTPTLKRANPISPWISSPRATRLNSAARKPQHQQQALFSIRPVSVWKPATGSRCGERESERQWMFSKWPNKISGQFYCC